MFQRKLLGPFEIAIHHGDQFTARQSGVLLCMKGAKIAQAHHSDPYRSALFAPCRRCTAHKSPLPPVWIFVVFLLISSDFFCFSSTAMDLLFGSLSRALSSVR